LRTAVLPGCVRLGTVRTAAGYAMVPIGSSPRMLRKGACYSVKL